MTKPGTAPCFADYQSLGYDEWFTPEQDVREDCSPVVKFLQTLPPDELLALQRAAKAAMIRKGITFTVYGDDEGTERIIPFDLIPRIIAANEWDSLSAGLVQRTKALNMFLTDVYGEQQIIKDGIIPSGLIHNNQAYRPEMQGITPPQGFGIISRARI